MVLDVHVPYIKDILTFCHDSCGVSGSNMSPEVYCLITSQRSNAEGMPSIMFNLSIYVFQRSLRKPFECIQQRLRIADICHRVGLHDSLRHWPWKVQIPCISSLSTKFQIKSTQLYFAATFSVRAKQPRVGHAGSSVRRRLW